MEHGPHRKNQTLVCEKNTFKIRFRGKVLVRFILLERSLEDLSDGTNSISLGYILAKLWCFKD